MATQSGWEMVPSRHQTLAPKRLARKEPCTRLWAPQLVCIEEMLRVPGVKKDLSVHGQRQRPS